MPWYLVKHRDNFTLPSPFPFPWFFYLRYMYLVHMLTRALVSRWTRALTDGISVQTFWMCVSGEKFGNSPLSLIGLVMIVSLSVTGPRLPDRFSPNCITELSLKFQETTVLLCYIIQSMTLIKVVHFSDIYYHRTFHYHINKWQQCRFHLVRSHGRHVGIIESTE